MKILLQVVLLASAFLLGNVWAADKNAPEEAVQMVKNAIIFYKENGRERALIEISKPRGQFVNKEIFTVVLDQRGVVLAHGAFPKLIGRNIMDLRDPDGVEMVKEMFTVVKAKGRGWVHYRFPNPLTKVLELKSTYAEGLDGLIIFSGVHISEKKMTDLK